MGIDEVLCIFGCKNRVLGHTNEQFISGRVFRIPEVISTNDSMRRLYRDGKATHGDVLIADWQTGGRGQGTRKWESERSKNLLCTFLFDRGLPEIENQVYLNMAVSLAVYHTVQPKVPEDVWIKWPNDLYIGKKKVAGILIENSLQQNMIRSAIIGIGINVNQVQFDIVDAVSLAQVLGHETDIQQILQGLSGNMETNFQILANYKLKDIAEAYNARLFGLNHEVGFVDQGIQRTAIFRGVDEEGCAIMEIAGKTIHYQNRSIQWMI